MSKKNVLVLFAQTEGHKVILPVTSINIDYWLVSSRIKLKRDNGPVS